MRYLPPALQDLHKPMLGGGVVIKVRRTLGSSARATLKLTAVLAPALLARQTNANQRYTSNAPTTFVLRRIAHLANVPVQEFEVRNDVRRALLAFPPSVTEGDAEPTPLSCRGAVELVRIDGRSGTEHGRPDGRHVRPDFPRLKPPSRPDVLTH